jgi:predicted DNA-binding transcriptional regulator YafY
MLKLIPKYPAFVLTKDIYQRLINEDFKTSKRTVERDLHKLSDLMGLTCSDSPEGYKWAYINNAREILPALSPNEALLLIQAKQYLTKVMPFKTLNALEPRFDKAESTLKKNEALAHWKDKIKVLPSGVPLISEELNQETHDKIYEAVLKEEQINIIYRKNSGEVRQYLLNPHGLIIKDYMQYLVASKKQTPHTLQMFKLAEIKKIERNFESNQTCEINLTEYLNSQVSGFLLSNGPVKIELNIAGPAYILLKNSKLSVNQTISDFKGVDDQNCGLLSAKVELTHELIHFLVGYGKWVEVVSPQELIDEIDKRTVGSVFK